MNESLKNYPFVMLNLFRGWDLVAFCKTEFPLADKLQKIIEKPESFSEQIITDLLRNEMIVEQELREVVRFCGFCAEGEGSLLEELLAIFAQRKRILYDIFLPYGKNEVKINKLIDETWEFTEYREVFPFQIINPTVLAAIRMIYAALSFFAQDFDHNREVVAKILAVSTEIIYKDNAAVDMSEKIIKSVKVLEVISGQECPLKEKDYVKFLVLCKKAFNFLVY